MSRREMVLEGLEILKKTRESIKKTNEELELLENDKKAISRRIVELEYGEIRAFNDMVNSIESAQKQILEHRWLEEYYIFMDYSSDKEGYTEYNLLGTKIIRKNDNGDISDAFFATFFSRDNAQLLADSRSYLDNKKQILLQKL